MNIYLWLRRSMESNIPKNSCFRDERSLWHIFPCTIECGKPQGTIYKGPQAIFTNTLEFEWVDRAFFRTYEVVENKSFWKKNANFPVKKTIWSIFSHRIEHFKCRGSTYMAPQGTLTFFAQMIWTFIWHLRVRQKQTFQKTAVFTMKEVFGPFFFELSSLTNLKEQNIMAHKVFWQLFWKLIELIEHFFRT